MIFDVGAGTYRRHRAISHPPRPDQSLYKIQCASFVTWTGRHD